MILKNGCPVLICAALLAWAGPSVADGYRADQFLGLDLRRPCCRQSRWGRKRISRRFQSRPRQIMTERPRRRAPSRSWLLMSWCPRRGWLLGSRPRPCTPMWPTPPAGSDPAGAPSRQPARRRGLRYPDPGLALQIRRHLQLAAAGQLEQIRLNGFILRDASLRDAPQDEVSYHTNGHISDLSCPHLLRASTSSKPFHIKRRGWPGRARPRRCGGSTPTAVGIRPSW